MNRRLRLTLAAGATAALLLVPACTKGARLGGTDLEPAAVETAGVPEFHAAHGVEAEHGNVGEHDGVATPHEQVTAPVVGATNQELEPGATTPGSLPPDGGNVVTEPPGVEDN